MSNQRDALRDVLIDAQRHANSRHKNSARANPKKSGHEASQSAGTDSKANRYQSASERPKAYLQDTGLPIFARER